MIENDILNYYSLDELRTIRDTWHEIDTDVRSNRVDKYEVTYDDEWYADRDIYTQSYTMRITTYKEEDNTTVMSDVIVLYDDDCEIGEVTIDELESFIKSLEG